MAMSSIECLAERVRMISEEFYWELFEDVQHAKIMHEEEIIRAYIEAGANLDDIIKEAAEQYYNETFNTKEK